jgi:sister chromatid cohesion protein PDS5
MERPNFRLAVSVCNNASEKLQRHVCQYFTDVILEHTSNTRSTTPSSDDEEPDFDEVSRAHSLIKALHAHCPALLHNIIPQLEEELRATNAQLRLLAAKTLGDMYADKAGRDLIRAHPTTWDVWMGRRNDVDVQLRLAWVEATHALLISRVEPRAPIEGAACIVSLFRLEASS